MTSSDAPAADKTDDADGCLSNSPSFLLKLPLLKLPLLKLPRLKLPRLKLPLVKLPLVNLPAATTAFAADENLPGVAGVGRTAGVDGVGGVAVGVRGLRALFSAGVSASSGATERAAQKLVWCRCRRHYLVIVAHLADCH